MSRIIYMAGPLFTDGERTFNEQLCSELVARNFIVSLPQAVPDGLDDRDIREHNINEIRRCDIVLANLDGPDTDSGTAYEIGYASALGKKIVVYRTDFRNCGDDHMGMGNLMITRDLNTIRLGACSLRDNVPAHIAAQMEIFNGC